MSVAEWRYRAFISYSQKDKTEARRLHRWLEGYRPPRGVLAPPEGKQKLGRFFRDDEEMGAAADIGATVRGAIEDSQCLIVLCSPRSAQSKWVNAEIHHFRRTGRGDKVFAVIMDGVPNAADPRIECFPPALRAGVDPDDPDAMPIEPLGLDLRKEGRARACARLAAGILGVEFDALWQRERKRRNAQRMLIAGVAASSVLALATAVGMFDRAAARDALTARAELLLQQGERAAAMPFALAGLGGERPEADRIVATLGGNFPLVAMIPLAGKSVEEIRFSPDGHTLGVRVDSNELTLWSAETGARIGANVASHRFTFSGDRVFSYGDLSGDILNAHTGDPIAHLPSLAQPRSGDLYAVAGDTLVAGLNNASDTIGVWNLSDGRLRFELKTPNTTNDQQLVLSKNGERLVVCYINPGCSFWDLTTGKALLENIPTYRAQVSDDGSILAAMIGESITVWDGAGRKIGEFADRTTSMALSPDGAHLAVATRRGGELFEVATGKVIADLRIVDSEAADPDDLRAGALDYESSDVFLFSPDSSRLLVKGLHAAAALWDVSSARVLMEVHTDEAQSIFVSPAFKVFVTQSFQRESTLWDGVTGQKIAAIPMSEGNWIDQVAFADGGALIDFETDSVDANGIGAVGLWRYDGRQLADFGGRDTISLFEVSADGRRFAAQVGDGNIALWDATRLLTGRGEILREGICRAARDGEPLFDARAREGNTVSAYVRGRPWNACDWRGLNDGAGWAQMVRYWAVRAGAPWDYSATSCSGDKPEFGCPARR